MHKQRFQLAPIFSHISGITLLAVPADIYKFGAAYGLLVVSMIAIVLVTAYIFLPVFFDLQITSTYEYLELRFDSRVRSFASFLFAFSVFLFLPIVIYIPALACSAGQSLRKQAKRISNISCGLQRQD